MNETSAKSTDGTDGPDHDGQHEDGRHRPPGFDARVEVRDGFLAFFRLDAACEDDADETSESQDAEEQGEEKQELAVTEKDHVGTSASSRE